MLRLQNGHYDLAVDAEHGARVVSLKALGREWLVQGDVATGDVFGGSQATGWDECFPTVLACDGKDFGWDGALRDHGVMWGRPWHADAGLDWLKTRFDDLKFSFSRRLALDGNTLIASYEATNKSEARIGYLYSQHLLLALNAGERISFTGIGPLSGYHVPPFTWPDARFMPVKSMAAGEAHKLYARRDGQTTATVHTTGGTLGLSWENLDLGLWLDYGGWPASAPVHQIAIEPTSAPFDGLNDDSVSWLSPGQTARWTITLTVKAAS